MLKIFNWLLTCCLFLAFQQCTDTAPEINNAAEFETYLAEEIEAQNLPALSMLVAKENEVVFEKYLGKANLEQDISLESDHLFLLASISKVITATALLQLHEDGLFALDDVINDYLPFTVSVPDETTPITFKMLLTHSSGIADGSSQDEQYYYGEDSPVALADYLEDYLTVAGQYYDASDNFHNFTPGTQHEYSNVGSALIGVLVEQISGTGFNTYCKENIFQPLGMNHTYWRLDEAQQANRIIAQPYDYQRNDFTAIEHYTFTDYPNGGLRSTPRDLMKLMAALMQNGNANNYQLLESSTVEAMLRPQIPALDAEVGLHIFQMNAENNLWGHDGGEQGVATIMAFNRDTQVGVIIFTNQGEADLDEMLIAGYELGIKL